MTDLVPGTEIEGIVVIVPASAWFTSNRMPTRRGHHKAMKDQLRWLARAAYASAGRPRVAGPVHLCWWIGYPPRARTADPSNAQPVTKALLDEYVRSGLLVDDSAEHVIEQYRRDTAAPPGTHTVRLTITSQTEETAS